MPKEQAITIDISSLRGEQSQENDCMKNLLIKWLLLFPICMQRMDQNDDSNYVDLSYTTVVYMQ